MKISYNNYPILKKLYNGSIHPIVIGEGDKPVFEKEYMVRAFLDAWNRHVKDFSSNVNILTSPFISAFNKAFDKTTELYTEMFYAGYTLSGTFINNDNCYMFYEKIDPGSEPGKYAETSLFIFDVKTTMPVLFSIDHGSKHYEFLSVHEPLRGAKSEFEYIELRRENAIRMSIFRECVNIETKHLSPGQKLKGIGCNYKNETKLPVTILDSKWFTTLVKSDEFKVRGHFRLQPCGEGHKDRKLIWVNDFMKHGYTAPAHKLKNESNGSKTDA